MSLNLNNNASLEIQSNFIGTGFQDIFTTPEGRARRQEARRLKSEGKYAEQMSLASALSGGGEDSRTAGGDNTMLFVGGGMLLLIVIGVGLYFALK